MWTPSDWAFADADTILAVGYLELYLSSLHSRSHDGGESGKKRNSIKTTRFLLFWSCKEGSLIQAIKSQLEDIEVLKQKGVELTIVYTGGNHNVVGRLDIPGIVKRELENDVNTGKRVCVVSYGPGGMADVVRTAVVGRVGKNGADVKLANRGRIWMVT